MIHDPEIRIHYEGLADLVYVHDPICSSDVASLAQSLRFILRVVDKLATCLTALEHKGE